MSGTKTNRTDLENRFKKGMYPTENDFANAFASFVHKDDTVKMSQVSFGEGGDNLGEVIDSKADKQTLETFVREVETVLETTRDSETGAITNSAISSILTILGKQNGESVSELASRFSALSGDYATVFAFVSKVKTFLESADIADTTINRWQEIETFLQGITDTETLTGLLQQMKQEILAEIPEPQPQPTGNYLELVEDLDDYTDAPDGKIVKYVGQTNEKYTRGFDYERKSTPLPSGQFCITLNGEITSDSPVVINDRHLLKSGIMYQYYRHSFGLILTNGDRQPAIGDKVWISSSHTITTITNIQYTTITLADGQRLYNSTDPVLMEIELMKNSDGLLFFGVQGYSESSYIQHPETKYYDTYPDCCKFLLVDGENGIPIHSESVTIGSTDGLAANSWQPIPSFNVIN